jgi:hypothetical protein
MKQYNRHAVVSIDEVIRAVVNQWVNLETDRFTLSTGHRVGVTSLRMRTFGRAAMHGNMNCVSCGCTPLFFAVETFARSKDQSIPHVNLYGKVGDKDVLFTHDHILARSLGGADNLKNSQIMCSPCNSKKSVGEGKLLIQKRLDKKGIKQKSPAMA